MKTIQKTMTKTKIEIVCQERNKKHCQGVYLYIKLPHATDTGDMLLPYGPHSSARLTYIRYEYIGCQRVLNRPELGWWTDRQTELERPIERAGKPLPDVEKRTHKQYQKSNSRARECFLSKIRSFLKLNCI